MRRIAHFEALQGMQDEADRVVSWDRDAVRWLREQRAFYTLLARAGAGLAFVPALIGARRAPP